MPPETNLTTISVVDSIAYNVPGNGPNNTLQWFAEPGNYSARSRNVIGSGGWDEYTRAFDLKFVNARSLPNLRIPLTGAMAGPFAWSFPGGEQNTDLIFEAKFVVDSTSKREQFGSLGLFRWGRIGFRYIHEGNVYYGPPMNINATTTRIQVARRFAQGVYVQLLEGVSGELSVYDYPPCPLPQIDIGFGFFSDYSQFPSDYSTVSA
jgi:hypothetical protein